MLLRLIHLLILASPVIAVTLWFSDNPGLVNLEWLGWRIETNVPVLLIGLLVVFAVLSGLEGLIALATGLPARIRASRRAKGHQQGIASLLSALKVAARGDADESRRLADEAARLLGAQELPERLAAVARPQGGEARLPAAAPRPPAAPPEPPPPARPSRWDLWQSRGRQRAARPSPPRKAPLAAPVAEPAPTVEPPVAATIPFDRSAFGDQIKAGEWDAAVSTVEAAATSRTLSSVEAARLKAVALAGQALVVEVEDSDKALVLSNEALRLCPGFLPAALQAIRVHIAAGRGGDAEALIGAVWRAAPARPLLRHYLDLLTGQDAGARLAQVEHLVRANPDHVDSHFAVGAAAAAAANWGLARRHLVAVAKVHADAEACRLMADVEENDGGDAAAVEMWRRKAIAAGSPPAWQCDACAATTAAWQPLCPSCGAVATVERPQP